MSSAQKAAPATTSAAAPSFPLRLGVDAGGSGTKWALLRGEDVLARGVTPPLTALVLASPEGAARLAALRDALPARPDSAVVGLPGLSAGTDVAGAAQARLAAALGLEPGRLQVMGDLDLAYRAHFQPGEGVLVYAGTGSIAYHVTEAGQIVRAGGRGYRIGDDGGGFSVGRAALRALTDELDLGRVPGSALAREVAGVTGGVDWDTLRAFAYGTPGAAEIARLAPAVGRAADAGDPDALDIVQEMARALADLAARVQAQTGPLPVRFAGGALKISPLVGAALLQQWSDAEVRQADHALAAAQFA